MVNARARRGTSKEVHIEPVRDSRETEAYFLISDTQNEDGRIPQHSQDQIQRLLDSKAPWAQIASEFTVVKGHPGSIPDPPVNLIRYLRSGQPNGTELFLLKGIAVNWYFELDPRRKKIWDRSNERSMGDEASERQKVLKAEVWADAEKKVEELLK